MNTRTNTRPNTIPTHRVALVSIKRGGRHCVGCVARRWDGYLLFEVTNSWGDAQCPQSGLEKCEDHADYAEPNTNRARDWCRDVRIALERAQFAPGSARASDTGTRASHSDLIPTAYWS